jgi:hypothetical protein
MNAYFEGNVRSRKETNSNLMITLEYSDIIRQKSQNINGTQRGKKGR